MNKTEKLNWAFERLDILEKELLTSSMQVESGIVSEYLETVSYKVSDITSELREALSIKKGKK